MVDALKSDLRKQIVSKKKELGQKQIDGMSSLITKCLIANPEIQKAKTIAFYLSKKDEVQTKSAIEILMKQQKQIFVPIVDGEHIRLVEFVSFDDLHIGKFGVPEPKTKKPAEKNPEVMVIPGIAFDKNCNRLGYGKGYYDRLLKKFKLYKIGICFDFQVVDSVPVKDHDEKMDIVITDSRSMCKEEILFTR
ncbi:MAG: 5-formyltetrahydrofolate cyclo-ligase [Candidatus Micrarchaeota archaeon]